MFRLQNDWYTLYKIGFKIKYTVQTVEQSRNSLYLQGDSAGFASYMKKFDQEKDHFNKLEKQVSDSRLCFQQVQRKANFIYLSIYLFKSDCCFLEQWLHLEREANWERAENETVDYKSYMKKLHKRDKKETKTQNRIEKILEKVL